MKTIVAYLFDGQLFASSARHFTDLLCKLIQAKLNDLFESKIVS